MMHNPIIKIIIYLIVYFLIFFSRFFIAHVVVPALIALRFDLAAPTQRVADFFFPSNLLVKRHSDFLSLGLFTGVGVMGDLVMLSVNPSGVEIIASSRISLNCC